MKTIAIIGLATMMGFATGQTLLGRDRDDGRNAPAPRGAAARAGDGATRSSTTVGAAARMGSGGAIRTSASTNRISRHDDDDRDRDRSRSRDRDWNRDRDRDRDLSRNRDKDRWDGPRYRRWGGRNYRWDNGRWVVISGGFYPEVYSSPVYYRTRASLPPTTSVEAEVQAALARRGYYSGAIDGMIGPASRNAIARYQSRHGLSVTGRIDGALLDSLGLD